MVSSLKMRKKILDAMKKRMEALVLFLDQRHREALEASEGKSAITAV